MDKPITLADLHAANIARQAEWCPDQVPDLSFRGNEFGGECGEAQNVIKKLERERLGWRGSRATVEQLAEELADVVICADLCAVTAGIDLAAAVVAKFNATSEKVGLTTRLVPTADWRSMADCPSDGRQVWVFGGRYTEPTLRSADGSFWRSVTAAGLGCPTHWHPEMKPLAPADALDIAGAA